MKFVHTGRNEIGRRSNGWVNGYFENVYDYDTGSRQHIYRTSDTQRVRKIDRVAGNNHWYYGSRTCYSPSHGETYNDQQNYFDNTHYNGRDSFEWYNSDGSKTYCKGKYVDYGWDYKSWSPENWRVTKPDECVYYNKTSSPAIRAGMYDYALPKVSNGVSEMVLRATEYREDQLGAFAGQITRVIAPPGFYIRCYTSGQFGGSSTDYTGDVDLGAAGNVIRSIRVTPYRPIIFSRSDNYLRAAKMAILLENWYETKSWLTGGDLDDGVFGTYESNVTAGITGLWVPPGFSVKVWTKGLAMRQYFGHNTNGFIPLTTTPNYIMVNLVMPVTFSLKGYTGFVTALSAGDNVQHPTRKIGSLGIPYGYQVVGRKFGKPSRTFRGNTALMSIHYDVLAVTVFYETHMNANMIDNLPVRTEVYKSKKDFETDCKKECDANYDCTAYYAIKMKRECPNPAAVNGEDPETNGCKQVCGFYEGSNDAIQTAKYKAIQPYLFDGKLRAKQHLFYPWWVSKAPYAAA